MSDKCFLDTNVLLYLYDQDIDKKTIAKRLLSDGHYISTQVLNEFSNISLKKLKLSPREVQRGLEVILNYTHLVIFSEKTILEALDIKARYGFGYYDSLILSTAMENNCSILFSEDMQHKQRIGDQLVILNPFV